MNRRIFLLSSTSALVAAPQAASADVIYYTFDQVPPKGARVVLTQSSTGEVFGEWFGDQSKWEAEARRVVDLLIDCGYQRDAPALLDPYESYNTGRACKARKFPCDVLFETRNIQIPYGDIFGVSDDEGREFQCIFCRGVFVADGPPIDDTRGEDPGGSACDDCSVIMNGLLDRGEVTQEMPDIGEKIEAAFAAHRRPLGCNATTDEAK